jgi:histidinol-phosphate aminotransferase
VNSVLEHENLIVLRTFSKWAGLAGLRVGYGVFPEAIMPQLWKIKQPYNVNVAGTVAALESLNDVEHLMGTVAKIVQERERLYLELTQLDFLRPYPSQANYILCRVVNRDARQLKLDLEGRGILVRYFSKPGLTDHIRISIGRPDQTDALLVALRDLS